MLILLALIWLISPPPPSEPHWGLSTPETDQYVREVVNIIRAGQGIVTPRGITWNFPRGRRVPVPLPLLFTSSYTNLLSFETHNGINEQKRLVWIWFCMANLLFKRPIYISPDFIIDELVHQTRPDTRLQVGNIPLNRQHTIHRAQLYDMNIKYSLTQQNLRSSFEKFLDSPFNALKTFEVLFES